MSKVIMISRDAKVLDKESSVYARVLEYSALFESLDIIVLSHTPKISDATNTDKLFIHDTTSRFKIFSLFKSFFRALKIAKKNKSASTWITSQDPFESGFLAFTIAKLSHIKLQLQFHTDCFNPQFIKYSIGNFAKTILARLLVPKADSIRVVSEIIKSTLSTFNFSPATHIFVLPIFTDIEKIKNEEITYNLREKFPEFRKIILVVARLEGEKNVELAIRSFQKMLRHDDTLGLVIAGSGSKKSWLKELVNYLGITNKVKFLGWVPEVSSLYKTSDILLVTSFYEGYGLNMVESVACGCPVVSTDVGVAEEVGATMVSYDAGEIALKVIEILNQRVNVELKKEFIIEKSEYMNRFKNTFI